MKNISIYTDYIKLTQLLKLSEICQSGGEAKSYIQNGSITVNGEIERRPGRKIKDGDMVSDGNCVIHVRQDGGNDGDKETSS